MKKAPFIIALTMAACSAAAQDYRPAFDPARLDDRPAGAANQVMVLGTPHLSQLPDVFRVEMLQPLIDRLVAWKPTAIAVENNAGLLCDRMRRMSERYREEIASYCFDPAVAAAATGLDVPAANARAEALLAGMHDDPSPARRRELAAAFLASKKSTLFVH